MSNPIEEFKRQQMKKFEKSRTPSKPREERSDATRVQPKKVGVESKVPIAKSPSSPYTQYDKEAAEIHARENEIRKHNEYINDPNFPSKINRDYADKQVKKTSFTDENTLQFWGNAILPSQQIGAVIKGVKDGSYQSYVDALTYGNSGVFPDAVAEQYPILTAVGNLGFDILTPYSISKFYRYATTPQIIGQGAEKTAWRMSPFSREVTYIGGDPAYMAEQSSIPNTLKYTYKGVTKDGQAVSTAPVVSRISSPTKELVQKMRRFGYYLIKTPEDTEMVWFNPRLDKVLADVEYGHTPSRGTILMDPEIIPSYEEYLGMIGHRKGGKLIPKYKK